MNALTVIYTYVYRLSRQPASGAKPLKNGEPAAAAAAASKAAAPKRSLSGGKGSKRATPAPARTEEATRVSPAPSKATTSKATSQDEPQRSRSECVFRSVLNPTQFRVSGEWADVHAYSTRCASTFHHSCTLTLTSPLPKHERRTQR